MPNGRRFLTWLEAWIAAGFEKARTYSSIALGAIAPGVLFQAEVTSSNLVGRVSFSLSQFSSVARFSLAQSWLVHMNLTAPSSLAVLRSNR
jgi:hypothetical protein